MDKSLRIATFLAPNIYPVYRFIADYIGAKLGLPTEFLPVNAHQDYDSVAADVSFICGLPYVLWTGDDPKPLELIAAPVLLGDRYDDKPIYFSDVIVAADSPYQSFLDLRGKKWAYNDTFSQSGYGITRQHLIQMGETRGYFASVIDGRNHQNCMQMVANGDIDGAAIDSQLFEVELMQKPELRDKLRVIDVFGPSSIQPVVVNQNLPDNLKADIQQALIEIGQGESNQRELAAGIFRRFAVVQDADYDDIRMMVAEAKKANFQEIQ